MAERVYPSHWAICVDCGRDIRVLANGNRIRHKIARHGADRWCLGSGEPVHAPPFEDVDLGSIDPAHGPFVLDERNSARLRRLAAEYDWTLTEALNIAVSDFCGWVETGGLRALED
jgi:hypothetical protein